MLTDKEIKRIFFALYVLRVLFKNPHIAPIYFKILQYYPCIFVKKDPT